MHVRRLGSVKVIDADTRNSLAGVCEHNQSYQERPKSCSESRAIFSPVSG